MFYKLYYIKLVIQLFHSITQGVLTTYRCTIGGKNQNPLWKTKTHSLTPFDPFYVAIDGQGVVFSLPEWILFFVTYCTPIGG